MARTIEQLDSQDPITNGKPAINPNAQPDDLIIIASQRGQHYSIVNQQFNCRVVLFDWTGKGFEAGTNPHRWETLSVATECKGHLMEVAYRLLERPSTGHYTGFIDDDVILRTSDIISSLALARIYSLSELQPAVSNSRAPRIIADFREFFEHEKPPEGGRLAVSQVRTRLELLPYLSFSERFMPQLMFDWCIEGSEES